MRIVKELILLTSVSYQLSVFQTIQGDCQQVVSSFGMGS